MTSSISPEEVRIRGGRDVDGQARIVVDVIGAAEIVFSVDDHEVVDAQPLELDGSAYPGETCPDDNGVMHLRAHAQTVPQVPGTLSRGLLWPGAPSLRVVLRARRDPTRARPAAAA